MELTERELRIERNEIKHRPGKEWAELVALYESRGVKPETAAEVATALMSDADQALEVHAREELGVDPANLGSPIGAALSSFVSFVTGAFVPLIPWLTADRASGAAVVASMILAAIGAITVGAVLARFTGRPPWRVAGRQLLFAVGSAAVAYGVGALVGVATPV